MRPLPLSQAGLNALMSTSLRATSNEKEQDMSEEAKDLLYERTLMQGEIDGLRLHLKQAAKTLNEIGRKLRYNPEEIFAEDFRELPPIDTLLDSAERLATLRERAKAIEGKLKEMGFGFVKFEREEVTEGNIG